MDADYENMRLDYSSIRVPRHASSGKRGRTPDRSKQRGKDHENPCNPLYLQLSAGNVHDSNVAVDVLFNIHLTDSMVMADSGYDVDEILVYIAE